MEPGVYSLRQALAMADAEGVDLVEISPNAEPPVCRIIDYSKFLYQQKKKEKALEKKEFNDYGINISNKNKVKAREVNVDTSIFE